MARRLLPMTAATIIVAGACIAGGGACAGLKEADDAGLDATSGEAAAEEDAAAEDTGTVRDAGKDVGAPPADFKCAEPWTTKVKTVPECAPRVAKEITPTGAIDVRSLAIARTPNGRVGIAFNSETTSETGEMHLYHFKPTGPTYPAPVLVKRATGFAVHDGYNVALAASGPDTLSLLTYDMADIDQSGEVHLRQLVNGVAPLTDDVAFTSVANPTEIGIASDPDGNIVVAARTPATATKSRIATKSKTKNGGFMPLVDITATLLTTEANGVGATSIVFAEGAFHLAYQHMEIAQHSNPRYHALSGTSWSYRKTIDNAIVNGLSGVGGVKLAVFGTRKYAAYFFRKAGQTPASGATADLRLAMWEGADDTPTIEILDQQIPAGDPLYPRYDVALGVDKFGLVHLAIVRPAGSSGTLSYQRQIRTSSGQVKWLDEVIDNDVVSDELRTRVAMVVDENARPHIAYVSAKDFKVRYATRYDR